MQAHGKVIWITGLSGAGKTTLAEALLPHIQEPKLLLDGDAMRETLALVAGGYDVESRKCLAHTYSRLCKLVAEQGVTVVCATISMFHEVRDWNRQNLPGYVEVYLKADTSRLHAQDVKNVYAKDGDVMGMHMEAEFPAAPDITITQAGQPVLENVASVMQLLK